MKAKDKPDRTKSDQQIRMRLIDATCRRLSSAIGQQRKRRGDKQHQQQPEVWKCEDADWRLGTIPAGSAEEAVPIIHFHNEGLLIRRRTKASNAGFKWEDCHWRIMCQVVQLDRIHALGERKKSARHRKILDISIGNVN